MLSIKDFENLSLTPAADREQVVASEIFVFVPKYLEKDPELLQNGIVKQRYLYAGAFRQPELDTDEFYCISSMENIQKYDRPNITRKVKKMNFERFDNLGILEYVVTFTEKMSPVRHYEWLDGRN